jgi:hypothetical protein
VLGANVLPEPKLAAVPQDTPQLQQRGGRIRDAAEQARDDGGVECAVRRRQLRGVAVDDLDRHRCDERALRRHGACRWIRLDREQLLHARRVVLERPTVSAPDLEHASAHPGEQSASQLAGDGIGSLLLLALEVACEARLLGARTASTCRPAVTSPERVHTGHERAESSR